MKAGAHFAGDYCKTSGDHVTKTGVKVADDHVAKNGGKSADDHLVKNGGKAADVAEKCGKSADDKAADDNVTKDSGGAIADDVTKNGGKEESKETVLERWMASPLLDKKDVMTGIAEFLLAGTRISHFNFFLNPYPGGIGHEMPTFFVLKLYFLF
jgi:hypothetical protein